ncbi:MAG: sugar porter family MFS transporter [Francisellaceae bacterium]
MQQKQKVTGIVVAVAMIAGMGGLLFGFDTGIIADTQFQLTAKFNLSDSLWGVIVSIAVFGAFLGALICGKIADRLGRKNTLILTAIGFLVGTTILGLAINLSMLLIGRFVVGFCIGVASFVSPLFISEISPSRHRGKLVLLNSICITGGEMVAFLSGYGLHFSGEGSWRLMFLIGLIPAVILILGLMRLPFSPRWIAETKGMKGARDILMKIRTSRQEVDDEIVEIEKTLSFKSEHSLKALFKKPVIHVLILGLGLGILQQFAGINVLMYYGPHLFSSLGASDSTALFLAFLLGLMNVLFTIVAVVLVDYLGRRILYLSGTVITASALFLFALSVYSGQLSLWLDVLLLCLYIMGFAISLGSMFWLLISEIFPLRIRGLAMSFCVAVQWLANFIVALSFLPLMDLLGAATSFFILAFINMLAFFFGMKYLPETKNMTLEAIEFNVEAGKKAREIGIKTSKRRPSITAVTE